MATFSAPPLAVLGTHGTLQPDCSEQRLRSLAENGKRAADDFGEWGEDEGAFRDAWVRDGEIWPVNGFVAVEQNVEVDGPRTPPTARATAEVVFDRLQRMQEIQRCEFGLGDDDRVQELGLIGGDGRRLPDTGAPCHGDVVRDEAVNSVPKVRGAVAEIRTEGDDYDGHRDTSDSCQFPRTTASATRVTRTISDTSWTRMMSAPPAMASATAADVPSMR